MREEPVPLPSAPGELVVPQEYPRDGSGGKLRELIGLGLHRSEVTQCPKRDFQPPEFFSTMEFPPWGRRFAFETQDVHRETPMLSGVGPPFGRQSCPEEGGAYALLRETHLPFGDEIVSVGGACVVDPAELVGGLHKFPPIVGIETLNRLVTDKITQ